MNNLKYDAVNHQAQQWDSEKISNRNLYKPSVMQTANPCSVFDSRQRINGREILGEDGNRMQTGGRSINCLDSDRMNRDDIYMSQHNTRSAIKMGPRADSMCQDRRQIKIENNLLEEPIDRFMSTQYHKGYQVPASITGIHQQSRMIPYDTCAQPSPCNKTSYGTYSTSTLAQYS